MRFRPFEVSPLALALALVVTLAPRGRALPWTLTLVDDDEQVLLVGGLARRLRGLGILGVEDLVEVEVVGVVDAGAVHGTVGARRREGRQESEG